MQAVDINYRPVDLLSLQSDLYSIGYLKNLGYIAIAKLGSQGRSLIGQVNSIYGHRKIHLVENTLLEKVDIPNTQAFGEFQNLRLLQSRQNGPNEPKPICPADVRSRISEGK